MRCRSALAERNQPVSHAGSGATVPLKTVCRIEGIGDGIACAEAEANLPSARVSVPATPADHKAQRLRRAIAYDHGFESRPARSGTNDRNCTSPQPDSRPALQSAHFRHHQVQAPRHQNRDPASIHRARAIVLRSAFRIFIPGFVGAAWADVVETGSSSTIKCRLDTGILFPHTGGAVEGFAIAGEWGRKAWKTRNCGKGLHLNRPRASKPELSFSPIPAMLGPIP